jgi:hypothetical protein
MTQSNPEITLAHKFINETKQAIFLTGKAGTGKTTFLKSLKEHTRKNLIVAAPTGVAAINAGGVTLHSLFQLPFTPFLPEVSGWRGSGDASHDKNSLLAKIKYNRERIGIIRELELLVIDEISMVRADVLDAIDCILRSVRRKHEEPFGGVQMLFIGDLYQLPPVAKPEEWELLAPYYNSPFFFESKALQQHNCVCIALTKIYRQTDNAFIDLLNAIRNNEVTVDTLTTLNQRHALDVPSDIITLTSHNAQATTINTSKLAKLPANSKKYRAEIKGDFSMYAFPAEEELELKLGAQVMFIKNDLSGKKQYFNGKIGVVTSLGDEEIEVNCPGDSEKIIVKKEVWENIKYKLDTTNNTLHEEPIGSFTQWPLRLAWAITIHKSQGLTFTQVAIEGARSFVAGQLYVALSRCTTLDGIRLLSKIDQSALHTNASIISYMQQATKVDTQLLFQMAQQHYATEVLMELYSFDKIQQYALQLQQLIAANRGAYSANSCMLIYTDEQQINKLQIFAKRFQQELTAMLQKNTMATLSSTLLQERTSKANAYFAPHVVQLIKNLKNYGISLDSKMLATETDTILNDMYVALFTKYHFYKASSGAFTIENYFARKANLHIDAYKPNSYTVGKNYSAPPESHHPKLYMQLCALRDELCEQNRLDVFKVANKKTLIELSNYLPCSNAEIVFISGFGETKARQYGDAFTEIIETYCHANSVESTIMQHPKFTGVKVKKAKQAERIIKEKIKEENGLSATVMTSLNMFLDGDSVPHIALARRFSEATIEGHLADAIFAGKLPVDKIMQASKLEFIQNKIGDKLDLKATEQKTILGDSVSYGELRIAMAHLSRMEEG